MNIYVNGILVIGETISEADLFKLIDSQPKPYAGVMNSSTYFMIKKRYLDGTIKQQTLMKFFGKFGYNKTDAMYIEG